MIVDKEISKEEQERYDELCIMALNFARLGKTKELQKMLNAKLPINLKDHKGNTLLMLASYNGNFETTKMLIEYKADVDMKNDRGQTPLAGVCFKGYLNIVKILVEAGANIYENNGMGTTPLMFASIFGNYEIVKYLNKQDKSVKSKIYLFISKFFKLIFNKK